MHTQGHPSLAEAFDLFLSQGPGRSLQADVKRIARRLRRLLSTSEAQQWPLTDLFHMDEMVLSSQGDKRRSGEMVLRFYDFLARRYQHDFDSELSQVQLIDNPTERQIEMVKYLHQPRSRAEVARQFGLESRTIRKDLQQLAQGTRFLGVELKTSFSGRDLRYRSSLHPVFLVMDLSQAYALTVGLLKLLSPGSSQYAFYEQLAANVYAQLSDYAKDRLKEQAPEEAGRLEALGLSTAPEWQSVQAGAADRLLYLVKSGEPATISLYLKGEERTYHEARLQWLHRDSYRVLPREGEPFLIREKDLLAIEDIDYR